MRAPVSMPAHSSNPGGANTMIVEPCWNQPSSSPLRTSRLSAISFGPR